MKNKKIIPPSREEILEDLVKDLLSGQKIIVTSQAFSLVAEIIIKSKKSVIVTPKFDDQTFSLLISP